MMILLPGSPFRLSRLLSPPAASRGGPCVSLARHALVLPLLCLSLLGFFAPQAGAQKPTLSMHISSTKAAEGNSGTKDVIITISSNSRMYTLFSVCLIGTATPGTDYRFIFKGIDYTKDKVFPFNSVCISTGTHFIPGLLSQKFTIRVLGDTLQERDETVTASLRNPGHPVSITGSPVTYTIVDDDRPTVSLSASPTAVTEGGTTTMTAALSEAAPRGGLTIPLARVAAHSTASSRDYSVGSISIMAGATSGTATLTATDDKADETRETLRLGFGTLPAAVGRGSPSHVDLTIGDNDPTTVSLARTGTGAIKEGDKVTFAVTLGRALVTGESLDAPLSIGGTNVTAGDWSLALKSGQGLNTGVTLSGANTATPTVRFSGAGAQTATLELTATEDGTAESGGSETFKIALGTNRQFDAKTGTNVSGGADPHGTDNNFSVQVNDRLPVVRIAGGGAITEGGSATFTLTASPAPAAALTVNVTVTDSGRFASSGQTGSKTVTVGTNGSGTLTVGTEDDQTDEPPGRLTATVGTGAGYSPHASAGTASVTVNDNDDPPPGMPVVRIAGGGVITEGGQATFTLTASPAPAAALTVNVTVTDSGRFASSGQTGSKTVTVGTNGSGTLTVGTEDDQTDEPPGRLTATVGTGAGYSPHTSAGTASVTVNDNDDPQPKTPVVRFASATSNADEDDGTVNVRVNLNPPPTAVITLRYTVGGTATAGSRHDFTITHSGSVLGAAKAAHVDIPVAVRDDPDDESPETVVLTLIDGLGYTVGSASTHTLTINDNDDGTGTNNNTGGTPPPPPPPPTVRLAVSPNPVSEGEAVTVTLTLSRVLSNPVTIPLTLTAGTAETGDYGALPRVTIPAGARTGTGTLSTTQDADADDETVTVAFGTLPSTVTAGTPDAVLLTITDTPTVRLAVSPNPVPEGQTVTVTLTLSRVLSNPVTIPLTLTAGTADAGDYGTLPSVTIPAGALTGTGTLSTVADADPDDETVTVAFGALPSTVTAGTPATVLLTLTDTSPTQLDRLKQALRRMLSAIGRRTLTGALDQLGARLAEPGTGTTLTLNGHTIALGPAGASPLLASLVPAAPACGMGHARDAGAPRCPAGAGPPTSPLSLAALLQASAFTLPLQAATKAGLSPTGPRWALWGRGDVGTFKGRPDAGTAYTGRARTGWLGLDARHGPWVAGLAVSHGTGTADYALVAGTPGRLETSVTTVHPYGRWTVADGLDLRVVLGAGAGRARHDPGTGPRTSAPLTLWLGSLGIRQVLPSVAGFTAAVRADASLTRIAFGAGPGFVTDVSADSWRGRAGVEVARTLALAPDTAVAPFVEAAVRRDGGDGIRGTGLEVAGGVRYTAPRVQVEARGRVLAAYTQGGTHEQGVSVTARVGPGAQGRGWSLALLPRWGAAPTGAQALWAADLPTHAATAPAPAALEAQVGYGVGLATLGLLTPFAEAGLTGETARHLRLGARLAAPRVNLRMTLAGEQRTQAGTRPVQALRLDSHWQF